MKHSPNIVLIDNNIHIKRLDHPSCVTDFKRNMNCLKKRKYCETNIIIDDSVNSGVFPNACLPISVLVSNSEELYGVKCNIVKMPKFLEQWGFGNPDYMLPDDIKKLDSSFNIIFKYSSQEGFEQQVGNLVQSLTDSTSKKAVCETGVLHSIIWCINEVMDNVLIHSEETYGYVMAQFHKKNNELAICVCDTGIGILDSFRKSGIVNPATEIEALHLAMEEGVSDGQGQGNGLYGLRQIISQNDGLLTITSGRSSLMYKKGEFKEFNNIPLIADSIKGTIVDFQINLSNEVVLSNVLTNFGGLKVLDFRLEDMWHEGDFLVYDILKNANGLGTRSAGSSLKNDIINTHKRTESFIKLDFSKVQICSSSFIDEFLVKLILELGKDYFSKHFAIINMNTEVNNLFERSLTMRLNA